MTIPFLITTLAASVLATTTTARADDVRQAMYAGVAMDTTVVSKLGYERELPIAHDRVAITVPAMFLLPMLRPGGGDAELRAGVRATVRETARFELSAAVQPFARITSNTIHQATALGVDLELVQRVRFSRWAAGLELGYDKNLMTRFRHTEAFRSQVYADVVDGWYRGGAAALRAGVRGELTHGRLALHVRGGITVTEAGNAELVPFYGELGVGYAL